MGIFKAKNAIMISEKIYEYISELKGWSEWLVTWLVLCLLSFQ